MEKADLIKFFESKGFKTYTFDSEGKGEHNSVELETYTKSGVNMLITLSPFTIDEFESYVKNFDIDEEIELHRQDKRYCDNFTIRESLEDFEAFKKRLEGVFNELICL